MARLPDPDPSDISEAVGSLPPPLRSLSIGRMLCHAPTLVAPYHNTYAAVLRGLELDPKLRQLAILRVAERASARYVLVAHRELAVLAGLTEDQISAVGQPSLDITCFTYVQRVVLAFTDEVINRARMSNSLFERINSTLTPREIVELILVIGCYWTACRLTTTLEIEPEHALGEAVTTMLMAHEGSRLANRSGDSAPYTMDFGGPRIDPPRTRLEIT